TARARTRRILSVAPFSSLLFFFLLIPPPPRSPLFPYTTLFRSRGRAPTRAPARVRGVPWAERRRSKGRRFAWRDREQVPGRGGVSERTCRAASRTSSRRSTTPL